MDWFYQTGFQKSMTTNLTAWSVPNSRSILIDNRSRKLLWPGNRFLTTQHANCKCYKWVPVPWPRIARPLVRLNWSLGQQARDHPKQFSEEGVQTCGKQSG